MKKRLLFIFLTLLIITAVLALLGLLFNKTEDQKQEGLSNEYDVSSQNTIAYVSYNNGKPQLFLYNEKDDLDVVAVEFGENTMILDPTFIGDGSILAFITTNKDKESELTSTVHFLDLRTKETTVLFTDPSTITEVAFKPDGSSLFYLRAGTFENYSPITGKRPHGYDIHEYLLEENTHEHVTELEQYSMNSLNVSPSGENLYIQMVDDREVETAEDSFDAKQRIFEIPVEQPEEMSVVSDPNREVDIFSFTLSSTGNDFIFQSVSNFDEGGTFKYELYRFNVDTKEEKQLTHLGEHASDPLVTTDEKHIYFMVDQNFAKGDPVYQLYRMSFDGTNVEKVALPTLD